MAHGFNCWHSKRTVVGHILKFAGKNWLQWWRGPDYGWDHNNSNYSIVGGSNSVEEEHLMLLQH